MPPRSASLTVEGKMSLLSSFASVHDHENCHDIPARTYSSSLQTRRNLLDSFYATSVRVNQSSTSDDKDGGGGGGSGGIGGDNDCEGGCNSDDSGCRDDDDVGSRDRTYSGSLSRKPTLVLSHTATGSGELVEPTGSPLKVNKLS